jgi:hypothetical protein
MRRQLIAVVTLTGILLLAGAADAGGRDRDHGPDLKRVTVVIKYADGRALEQLLRPYLTKYGQVQFENKTRALTIVDQPAVVDVMLKMVARFDVKPPQLQLSIKLVMASKEGPKSIPPELQAVAKQLKDVFNYTAYKIMDKAFVTTEANGWSRMTIGGDQAYTVDIETHVVQGEKNTVRMEFHLYRMEWVKQAGKQAQGIKHTVVQTTVEMKDGQTAILGASKIDGGGRALITVVSMMMK